MSQEFIFLAALIFIGFCMIVWIFAQKLHDLQLANQGILKSDKEAIYKDNTNKKEAIESLIRDLKKDIEDRQSEIRELEKDRNKKFGDIQRSLEEHRSITQELKTSTETLGKVLSNNQIRGAWGEKIIEEILNNAGLVESIHYQKQKILGKSTVKPDITLLLPNGRKVSVDVKFPYAQIQQASDSTNQIQKQEHIKLFEKDIREKLNQIEKRGYINIEEGTLDYAIMFVPNEMLFSFINQKFPGVIDEAMDRKIMIVSPFTFLIVARTVMESYKNFMVENNLRKIVKHIQEFAVEWEKFEGEFSKFDEAISRLRKDFDQVANVRYKKMSIKIKRINDYQQLQGPNDRGSD